MYDMNMYSETSKCGWVGVGVGSQSIHKVCPSYENMHCSHFSTVHKALHASLHSGHITTPLNGEYLEYPCRLIFKTRVGATLGIR